MVSLQYGGYWGAHSRGIGEATGPGAGGQHPPDWT